MTETTKIGGVDLHTHTTASDGELTPRQLVEEAERIGLDALGITDHDTVAGIPEALSAAKNVRVIPGIEISCDVPKGNCHILGYFIDHESPFLKQPLEFLRERRRERAMKMIERLRSLGIIIDVADRSDEYSVGRPHIAEAMKAAGYVGSTDEAFQLYLAEGRPAYLPSPRMIPAEAIGMILRAGGVPVLAHPHTFDNEMMIKVYAREGLCGLEAEYATYDHTMKKKWTGIADRLGLLSVAGSDFHGSSRPDRRLGMVRSAPSIIEMLFNKRRATCP